MKARQRDVVGAQIAIQLNKAITVKVRQNGPRSVSLPRESSKSLFRSQTFINFNQNYNFLAINHLSGISPSLVTRHSSFSSPRLLWFGQVRPSNPRWRAFSFELKE
jgi:hypothetical protein